jgi:hypothetical protein
MAGIKPVTREETAATASSGRWPLPSDFRGLAKSEVKLPDSSGLGIFRLHFDVEQGYTCFSLDIRGRGWQRVCICLGPGIPGQGLSALHSATPS